MTLLDASPRWSASDRLPVNPCVRGAAAPVPAPAEPRRYAPDVDAGEPVAIDRGWQRRGFAPRRWVWSVDLKRLMDLDEAATMAGVQRGRIRTACTPWGQMPERRGSVGRGRKFRFRWPTAEELAASGVAGGAGRGEG